MKKDYSNSVEFVEEVEKFSRSKLNKKAELLRIYEEVVKNDKQKIFEELAFTAKYLRGLMRVLQKGMENPEVKSLEHVKKDFSSNIKKVKEQIREIISNGEDSLKNHFEEKYFAMTQEGLQNLNELLSDLEWTKKYLNEEKRREAN